MSMIRAIDTRIVALHQALVNASGKKPRWWASHTPVLLLASGGYLLMLGWSVIPKWVSVLFGIGLALVCAGMTLMTSTDANFEDLRTCMSRGSRMMSLMFFAVSFLWMEPCLIVLNFAVLVYENMASCEDPPPPKPRTRTSLAGSH